MSCAVTPRQNTARYCTSRSGSAYRYDSSQAPADCQISPSDMSVVARINSAAASHIETYAAAASATEQPASMTDRKSTRLNSSHLGISYAVFCLKKKKN